jgi:predicted metal-binding protein
MHDCLSMCDEPTAIALQADAKATYLFSGVTVEDAAAVRAALAAYDAAENGWIADARPLGRLRFCLKGRVPA